MKPRWELLHQDVDLGAIAWMLDDENPESAAKQFDAAYRFGGWDPFPGFTLYPTNSLGYPNDAGTDHQGRYSGGIAL